MQVKNVKQGASDWSALRAQYPTASEAPAMMGASKHQTRDELMRQKATGIVPEVSHHQQVIFDRGHAAEAAARLLLEEMTGEEFFPITAISDDGKLLASLDGITMDDSTLFEHKLWNEKLALQVRVGDLEPHYYWQLEQQLLVTGAQKVIFVCSNGTKDSWAAMEYFPVPGRAEQLQAGWAQFDADKAAYVPTEAAPVIVAAAVTALPAVSVQVTGSISIKDNFKAFEVALKDFIEHRLIRKPETDQDFVDLDTQIKALKGSESALDALESQMLSQVEAVDMAKRTKDMLLKMARENRLMAEKLLAARKDQIKVEQVQRGQKALAEHVAALNARLGKPYMPAVQADFAGAIKGLRTVESLKNAIDTLLAQVKIENSAIADKIQLNLEYMREHAKDFAFLFSDASTIVLKANDDLTALVKTRIAEHQAAEVAKEEATRARIRDEEVARLEREQAEARRSEEQNAAATSALQGIEEARRSESMPAPLLDALEGMATNLIADMAVSRAAESSRPLALVMPMRDFMPAPAQTPPSLKLGEISQRLGFSLTGEFLKNLGFEPAGRDKNAVLFHEADFSLILTRLVAHIQGVQAKQAA